MSCSEVMYQAYYPYLYQRPGATPAHPVPRAGPFPSPFGSAHQYDRFNVQRLQDSPHPSITACSSGSVAAVSGRGSDSSNPTTSVAAAAVVSVTGASASYSNSSTPSSPRSHSLPSAAASISLQPPLSVPVVPHKEEDSNTCAHGDDSCCSDEGGESPGLNVGPGPGGGGASDASTPGGTSRAQYMSANCVVFTHYQGDAATVVDEHFTKALDKTDSKEISPMSARNFPASFWNSAHHYNTGNSLSGIPTSPSDGLYHQSDGAYHPSDWYHQYSQYHHHHHHQHHHHPMAAAAGYSGLLLPPPGSRLHMSAAAAGAAAAQCKAIDWQHAAAAATLDNPYSSYPSMSGLEAQVQDSSKDLYWF